MRRRIVAARCVVAALAVAVLAPAIAGAGEDDSPWPEGGSDAQQLSAVRDVLGDLEDKTLRMEISATRYADWESCLHGVPVTEYGDHDRTFGFQYDERDGTGLGHMPALAVDRRHRHGGEEYLFLDFARDDGCRSSAPLPGGTADPASVSATAASARGDSLRGLERRVRALKRAVVRLEAASERFDAWESCVSWVPVTEHGDPDGGFGYVFEQDGQPPRYRPALAVDRSDWDDPDYMLLALVGGDRPGGTCQDEPGEAVD